MLISSEFFEVYETVLLNIAKNSALKGIYIKKLQTDETFRVCGAVSSFMQRTMKQTPLIKFLG